MKRIKQLLLCAAIIAATAVPLLAGNGNGNNGNNSDNGDNGARGNSGENADPPATVPDSGTTAAILGVGLVGLAGYASLNRYRSRRV